MDSKSFWCDRAFAKVEVFEGFLDRLRVMLVDLGVPLSGFGCFLSLVVSAAEA